MFLFGINVSYSRIEAKSVIKQYFMKGRFLRRYSSITKVQASIPFDYWMENLPLPDTTFQKFYPNIISELASGWGIERMMHTRTFIRGETGSVLVNNSFFRDESMRLLILIDSLKLTLNVRLSCFIQQVNFFTGLWMDVTLTASIKKKKQWKIIDLKLDPSPWKGYMFPIDSLFDKH